MIRYEFGDLVNGDYPFFCQQVNCKGVMGAGLAKQIRSKYPEVYTEYRKICSTQDKLLGTILLQETNDHRMCCNMFAQDGYGRSKRYTDYNAFKACLEQIKLFIDNNLVACPIAFPYLIGCGLAGGDWVIVNGMLTDFSKQIEQDVIIVSLT